MRKGGDQEEDEVEAAAAFYAEADHGIGDGIWDGGGDGDYVPAYGRRTATVAAAEARSGLWVDRDEAGEFAAAAVAKGNYVRRDNDRATKPSEVPPNRQDKVCWHCGASGSSRWRLALLRCWCLHSVCSGRGKTCAEEHCDLHFWKEDKKYAEGGHWKTRTELQNRRIREGGEARVRYAEDILTRGFSASEAGARYLNKVSDNEPRHLKIKRKWHELDGPIRP